MKSAMTAVFAELLASLRDVSVIRTGLGSFGLRILGLASTFALGVLLARILGPVSYGRYGLTTTIVAVAMNLAHMGTPQLVVRELSVLSLSRNWAAARKLIARSLLAVTASSVCIAGVAIVVGGVMIRARGDDLWLITLGSMLMILMTLTALMASQLRGVGALLQGQFFDIVGRPAMAFLVMGLLVLTGFRLGTTEALLVQVGVTLVAVLTSLVWLRASLPAVGGGASPDVTQPAPLTAAALPLWAVDILRVVDGSYGVLLVGWLADDVSLGIFRVAVACGALLGMPVAIAHVVFAPRVAQLASANDGVALQALLSRISAALVLVSLPMTILLGVAGNSIVTLVFGAPYASAWLPLFFFSIAQLAFGLFGMGPIFLVMANHERYLVKISTLSVILGMALTIPLVHSFGVAGAAMAQVASFGTVGVLCWRFARRTLGIELTFIGMLRPKTTPAL